MGPIRAQAVASEWRTPICVVMIETVQAVSRADEILAVPGIDAIFVGPNDLAVSTGLDSGCEGHPDHRLMIEKVAQSARSHGIVAGIMCGSPEVAKQWQQNGYQMVATESDTRLLTVASEQIVSQSRNLIDDDAGR